ncbi:hypothetical protein D9M71_473670 [compost metagenome]
MDHRIADLHAGWVTIEQDSPDLLLQQPGQLAELLEVRLLAEDGSGQLAVQTVQRGAQLCLVRHFDHHGGRAEHFRLQDFITLDQQADISFEQLRLRLPPLLRMARQVLNTRMIEERLQALRIAAQRPGVEHGLRRFIGHHVGQ